MATQPVTRVIVKNLPEGSWTHDYLRNFVEVVTGSLCVEDDRIQVFKDITHTVLLTLEEPVSVEAVREAQQTLIEMPFIDRKLVLEAVTDTTCSVLVHFTDPHLSPDDAFFYFDDPQRSGRGEGEVKNCDMHLEVLLVVVQFSSPEAAAGVLAKGEHRINTGGEAVQVEPWYEQFHRPLLLELLARREHKAKPAVPPRPKQMSPKHHTPSQGEASVPPPGYVTSGGPPSAPQHPASDAAGPALEELLAEMEKLRLENEELKSTEAKKAPSETLKQQVSENEKRKSEKEKLKLSTVKLSVPDYQLRLLKDFADQWKGCQVTMMEQQQEVLFYGAQEDCVEGKRQFLRRLQNLADDNLPISPAISKVLVTPKGRRYLDDMVQKYPRCSATVQNSCLLCGSVDEEALKDFKRDFEANIVGKTCKVPSSLRTSPQFLSLKTNLENEYPVTLTISSDDSEDVQLEGFKGDVELVASEVDKFTVKNRQVRKRFHIHGSLTGSACKKWFSRELDEAKEIIVKNGGKIDEETTDGEYTLTFQCRQEVLDDVMQKLNVIKDGIISGNVDLNKEFPLYSERALVINGLNSMGVGPFCSQLAEKLRKQGLESLGDFHMPERCQLQQFRLSGHKDDRERTARGGRREHRSHSAKSRGRGEGHSRHHHTSQRSSLPCSVTVGNTNITVKSGDITTEQVGAAVCVVGKDLSLTGTAIGSAFLKKCPSLAQALQAGAQGGGAQEMVHSAFASRTKRMAYRPQPVHNVLNPLQAGVQSGGANDQCRLVTTAVPTGTPLPMSVLFHTVLNKMPRHAVTKHVKQLVQQSLQLSVQYGLTTIAFPPLGVGRRFGYGRYTVASAMMSAFQEFLQTNPNSLQSITVVVYDRRVAAKFAEVLKQKLGTDADAAAAAETTTSSPDVTSEEEDVGSTDSDHSNSDTELGEEEEVPDFMESHVNRFEAMVCTPKKQDCKEVIDILLKELKTTFLWHETIRDRDAETFQRLGVYDIRQISQSALKTNVHMTMSKKGLRLCGQKDKVHELLSTIRNKMYIQLLLEKKGGSTMRQKLGLPVGTDRLPSYWKVCKKEKDQTVSYLKASESWRKRGVHLNSVTKEERKAVEDLVESTWEADKAGAGADARNLAHTAIQVTKVERLENPEMWQEYSHKRERLFHFLELHRRGSSAAHFTPVENLRGSRGPVQTTANIAQNNLLCRDIYPQVNEHYLFHGTKKESLTKIHRQGLDFRVASDRTMLGPGVYASESSTKADQYTDPKQARTNAEELTMILMRMLLGEPFLHTDKNPSSFKRPPCMKCCKRTCSCTDSRLFDSIIDDSNRIFREFVVYEQNVCYPEYLITYKRV